MSVDMYQIGEVASAVGLSLRTIRHYEEVDLVPPSGRTSGGFRLYTDEDVERLRLVKDLKPLGFSLEEMRAVLTVRDELAQAPAGSARDAELRDMLGGYADAADERCAALREQLRTSEAIADQLRREALGLGAASAER